jgi:hypothetical protein
MNEQPINYPYLTGTYEAVISIMAYSLTSKGLADYAKYDEIKAYLESEISRIKQAERKHSNNIDTQA